MLILQLDSSGQPIKWISWEDAITYHSKGMVNWSLGEEIFTARGGYNRILEEDSKISTSSIIAIKKKNNSGSRKKYDAPRLTNDNLFKRDNYTCAYCGKKFHWKNLTRDHIIPVSKGGDDSWMNVVSSCGPCNNRKDNYLLEHTNMKLLYKPFVPSFIDILLYENTHINEEQLNYLKLFLTTKRERQNDHQHI